MPPAVCWRAWRNGLSIRCGWGRTLMWAQALRVPQWGWEPKRMVGGPLRRPLGLFDCVLLSLTLSPRCIQLLSLFYSDKLLLMATGTFGERHQDMSCLFSASCSFIDLIIHISGGFRLITPGPLQCFPLLPLFKCLLVWFLSNRGQAEPPPSHSFSLLMLLLLTYSSFCLHTDKERLPLRESLL